MTSAEIKREFVKLYGGTENDVRVFHAPGRVNLIGEHTDYNGGYVFPTALTMGSMVAIRKNNTKTIRIKATDLADMVSAPIANIDNFKDIPWGNYQLGSISELIKRGCDPVGADMLFDDTLPHGGGLSSSAAAEVSTCVAYAAICDFSLSRKEAALCGQAAERNYCGVNCGIMDQFASANGKRDHALLINCKTLEYNAVPVKLDGYKIVISNTNKKHSLAQSAYNERRRECEEGLSLLKKVLPGVSCLGDITAEQFEENKSVIKKDTVLKRVQHVIYEDDRVLKSVEALKNNNILAFGSYMNQSHDSLRDLYEVTGIELDTIVECAREIDGVIGSRMTGAGFGGSSVSIVEEDKVDEFISRVSEKYNSIIGIEPSFYVDQIGDGVREI